MKTCPDPVDVQDLQFKLHCRLKIFENDLNEPFSKQHSLVATASRFGLLFVGTKLSSIQVIQLKSLENYSTKDKDVIDYPRRNIDLPSPPKHLSLNCDSTILAVVIEKAQCPIVQFYDVKSFVKQNISLIKEIRLSSTPGVIATEINWNPTIPTIFTACKSDGTLGVYELKGDTVDINELPTQAGASCFCWSPKGKQIAVGSKDGKITQYKPDLKAVKVINAPPLQGVYYLLSLQWVSNYQFIGVFHSTAPEGQATLIVVDAPKTGDTVYTNYEDICYSSGSARNPQFYMQFLQNWNLLLVASANGTEVGVLRSVGDLWTQIILGDAARAELPLSSKHQETLPIGLAVDVSSTRAIPWGESQLPPQPILCLLSHHGLLCTFDMINLTGGVQNICSPPEPIPDANGLQSFVTKSDAKPLQQIPTLPGVSITPISKPVGTALPTFGGTPTLGTQPLFGNKQATPATPQNIPIFGQSTAKPATQEHKPIFGQTVPQPVTSEQKTMPMFGGQSILSTPTPPQHTSSASVTATTKYGAIFSALSAPDKPILSNTAVITVAAAVQPPTFTTTPGQTVQKIAPTTPSTPVYVQPKPQPVPVQKVEPPPVQTESKPSAETEALLAQMIREECLSLETELKALIHHGRMLKINLGKESDKTDMVKNVNELEEFIKELVDISSGQNAEVHSLKQNLIQSWAWYEEAKSRYNASKDEAMTILLRAQPLDSASEKQLRDIRHSVCYLETQLYQASKALDEQWDNFQNYAKKTYKNQQPTMEKIFKTMVGQSAVLQKQSYILKDIQSRIKSKNRCNNDGPSLILSLENAKDLEESLDRLKLEPQDICQFQYERVLNRTKCLSENKTNKLRNLLKNREVSHVTVVKPQLSSSIMQSPAGKNKQSISIFGAQMSPVTKSHSRQLIFNQATSSTTEEGVKTGFKGVERPISTITQPITASSSFLPVTKSSTFLGSMQSHLAQNLSASAFVPTTQSTPIPSSTKTKPSLFGFGDPTTSSTTFVSKTTLAASTPTSNQFSFTTMSKTTNLPLSTTTNTLSFVASSTTTSTAKPQSITSAFSFGSKPVTAETPKGSSQKEDVPSSGGQTLFGTTSKPFTFGGGTNLFGTSATAPSSTQPMQFSSAKPQTSSISIAVASKPSVSTGISEVQKIITTKPVVGTTANSDNSNLFKSSTSPSVVFDLSKSTSVTSSSNTSPSTGFSFANPNATSQPLFGSTAVSKTPAVSTGTTTQASNLFKLGSTATPPPIYPTTAATTTSSETVSSTPPSTTAPVGNDPIAKPTLTISSNSKPSIFSTNTSTMAKPSIFGNQQTATIPNFSMFGGTSTITIAGSPSVVATTTTTSVSSIFGASGSITPISTVLTSTAAATDIGSSLATSTTSQTIDPIFSKSPTATLPSSPLSTVNVSIAASPSPLGTIVAPSVTRGSSIFGQTPTQTVFSKSDVSTSSNSSPTITPTTGTAAVPFGTVAVTSTTQTSLFGQAPGTASTTAGGSIFGQALAVSSGGNSIFGQATVNTTTSGGGSPFGTPATGSTSTIFGQSSSSASSVFGGATPTSSSIFGSTPSTSSSIFGAKTQASSVFGDAAQPSMFGGTSTATPSIFGAQATAATTASVFGGAPTTTQAPFAANASSPFGSSAFNTAATTSSNSPFGQTNSVFGTPKSTASGFGQSPVFGGTATTSSVFGQTTTFGSSSGSIFGGGTTTSTSSNVFGGTPNTNAGSFGSGGSVFGTTTSAVSPSFGMASTSNNVFGAAATQPSSFSFATASANTASAGSFGFGGLNVGAGATTTSSNVFGGSPAFGQSTASNPFGRKPGQDQKSTFGSGGSLFGTPASSSNSIFGSSTGSAFGSNSQGFGTSTFGSPSAFGQQPAFGQSNFGSSSFGSPQPGPFSGGGGSSPAVAQSGFGSPSSFQKPSAGFGSPPAFGGSPTSAFGGAPSFGGAPAFGSAPVFGSSPNKVFGGASPTGAFGGAGTQQNPSFGNLATQNTVGFGSLAQQSTNPTSSTPFAGSSSFSSWR